MKAILLCAGAGSRFQPASFTRPKHLVPINGLPLLEHSLGLLHATGVTDITLVIGHLAEQFEYLEDKYAVRLLFNPAYAAENNNGSLALACQRAGGLNDTLILDGDVLFTRDVMPQIFECRAKLGPEASFFVSQKTQRGLEWELALSGGARARGSGWAARRIRAVHKWSPTGFAMCGCSYWAGEAAGLLSNALAAALSACMATEVGDYSWEDVAIRILDSAPLYALCLAESFALELDTLRDALDCHLLSHEEIARICSVNYTPVKLKGLTNNTWKIRSAAGAFQVLRVPGQGTERYIKREEEPRIVRLLADLGVTPATQFFQGGFKLTDFLPRHRVSTAEDMSGAYFASLAACLKKMHAIKHDPEYGLEPVRIGQYARLFEAQSGYSAPQIYAGWLREWAERFDGEECVLCHRDLLLENIMVLDERGGGLQLIDFEYAGFTHPLWDYASFILESGIEGETREKFMLASGINGPEAQNRLANMEILQDYIWGMWGLVNNYRDYAENRLKRSFNRLAALLGADLPPGVVLGKRA